ncbi:MAG: glycosyltransferase [Flavobacteriaceae bacterium]
MEKKVQITATIVLYNEDLEILQKTVNSFLNIPVTKKLFLVDNSPNDKLKKHFKHKEIEYFFVGKNLGFGKAHNTVLEKIESTSHYHLILNPDVIFSPDVISNLIQALNLNADVSMIAPRVVYADGKPQYTSRKYPTFFDLFIRRVPVFKNRVKAQEYRDLDLNQPFHPNFIHGCFMLFKTQDFFDLKGFDERYFLYMEDVDICKKIDQIGKKKMYYPSEQITHLHKKESSKKLRLFFIHVISAIKYFNKWGY